MFRSELFDVLRAQSISTLNADQDDYIEMAALQSTATLKEQTISQALRMELIRSICGGISDAVCAAHKVEDSAMITPLHFAPPESLCVSIGSDKDRDWICNHSFNRFATSSGDAFIDYSPFVFKYMRKHCYGINDYQFIESVTLDGASDMSNVGAKFSEGRSGSFFFQTEDNEFLIKTIPKSEMATFLRILPVCCPMVASSSFSENCFLMKMFRATSNMFANIRIRLSTATMARTASRCTARPFTSWR